MSRASKWLVVATLAFPSLALADEAAPQADRSAQVIVSDPNYQQQPQPQPYQQPYQDPNQVQVVEEPVSPAHAGRGLEYGGSLFVPVWIRGPGEVYSPGIGIDLRAGWELGGGLSIDGHLGFTYNGVRDAYAYYYDDSLQSAYLGVGLRYAFLNRSALVPFLQAGIQLNLWSYCYGGTDCSSSFDTVNFGTYGGGGILVELNPNLSIDFGLNFMMVLGNNRYIFNGFEKNVQPFIGATLYY